MNRLLSLLVALGFASRLTAADVDFNRDVRPILSDNCFACHGPDEKHRKAEAAARRRGGRARRTGGRSSRASRTRASWSSGSPRPTPTERMPPAKSGKKLTAGRDRDCSRGGSREGAKYAAALGVRPADAAPPCPTVEDADWPRNRIDRFVLARLEAEGLTPSPEADRVHARPPAVAST